MRTIKLYSTVGKQGEISTSVTTFGELKVLIAQNGVSLNNMKCLIGETRNELSEDSAILPEGDFKLYLVPVATKSGGVIADDLLEIALDIENLTESIKDLTNKVRSLENPPRPVEPKKATPMVEGSLRDWEEEAAMKEIAKMAGK